MFKWLRNRIELLKNDKQLALIMLLHNRSNRLARLRMAGRRY